ncbi:MAG TPA: protein kinase [Bryobacteraceae bacterium]|nr:protein kinase [Bryobacteraceae bacterium]
MSFQNGERLGPYEIHSPLGAGGMGTVYRARDTRLGRDVAIKVSEERFSERFEREARAIASLNHPNICHLYDVGPNYLVMELIEGESPRGPLPLDEALRIARQIANALEAAHEKGIIHRDLKPGNIKITHDGTVKVLDFGLAKFSAPAPLSGSAENSPTISMAATQAGIILGTASYMAPEQARGKPVDKRADIWAFGVVLCELVTGKRVFHGEDGSEVLAAVIKDAPNLEGVPPKIRPLLELCLQKDPKKRLRDIGDMHLSLEDRDAPAPPAVPPKALLLWQAIAALLLITATALGFIYFRQSRPAQQVIRFPITFPENYTYQALKLSPDGRYLAYAEGFGGGRLWVRALDSLEARALPGTEGARFPFWSPDGAYLGFFAQGKLKKIALAGGPPQILCDVADARGGTWNRDGVILFSPGPSRTIFREPAAGGAPSPVTKFSGTGSGQGHRFPEFLPDGVHFFYHAASNDENAAGVYIGSLDGRPPMRLLPEASSAVFAPRMSGGKTGYLLFRRENTLVAQPFDPAALKTTGDVIPLAEQVAETGQTGSGSFSVSSNGILVYRTGASSADRELVWMDRTGKRVGPPSKAAPMHIDSLLSLSPDEKSVAISIGTFAQADVWILDVARNVLKRTTFVSGSTWNPTWSPDGRRLVYGRSAGGGALNSDLYAMPASGGGSEELLLRGQANTAPLGWSPDGKLILYQQSDPGTAVDLWILPLEGERKPVAYLQTPFDEEDATLSPDGKWVAYASNESGQPQVYLQSMPVTSVKYQISSEGGDFPRWRRDGKELFYLSPAGNLMAVPIKLGATPEFGTAQVLFGAPGVADFAPTHDGQRFVLNAPAGGQAPSAITAVVNWQSRLP